KSYDLTPCEFFLWPYLKNLTFQKLLHNPNKLRKRTVMKIDELKNNHQMFANVITAIVRIVQICLEVGGEHLDYIL
ncbi:hypothetical protein BDFB_014236, partial [Asbolus verrucosus]